LVGAVAAGKPRASCKVLRGDWFVVSDTLGEGTASAQASPSRPAHPAHTPLTPLYRALPQAAPTATSMTSFPPCGTTSGSSAAARAAPPPPTARRSSS
jgi:hypothetical protein